MTHADEAAPHLALLNKREKQCRIEYRGYAQWRARITPLRWFTVAGGIILSALAGATIFGQPAFLGKDWPTYAGVFALIASILQGLHTALNCDTHQSECRRLESLYQSLELGYQAARTIPSSEIAQRVNEMEAKFENAKLNAVATFPASIREKLEAAVTDAA